MKRSRSVQRVLLGGLSAGALTTCVAAAVAPRITPENYYTNDFHVPGAGFYHAPFQGFFPQPYNYYDPQRRMYFHGGQWSPTPHRSIVNISTPTAEAARRAESARTDIQRTSNVHRGGFGHTSRSFGTRS